MPDTTEAPDGITGALSRAGFDLLGRAELRRAARYHRPTSLLLVEIAAFRRLVERNGNAAGDAVLQNLVALIRTQLREHDTVARIGDASFAALLPETAEAQAMFVAERLCHAAADLHVDFQDRPISFSVSIGVTCCIDREDDLDGILQDADVALCVARRGDSGGVALSPTAHMTDDNAA